MEEIKLLKLPILLFHLGIRANPACKVDVILDEETGDVIEGPGNGLIVSGLEIKNPHDGALPTYER